MGLLDRVFGFRSSSRTPSRDEALAAAIAERVIDATDKRLRLVSGHRKLLQAGALTTLAHIQGILAAIPGPIAVSAKAWSEDRALRPFFARAPDVPTAFSRSRAVRSVFAGSTSDECVAVLAFEHNEREVIAVRAGKDGLPREVICTAVSFDHPTVLAAGADVQTARTELGKRAVDYLAMKALAKITDLKQQMKELEEERALLKMRLQIARAGGRGLAGMDGEGSTATGDAAALARDLKANERALAGRVASSIMSQLVDELRAVLGNPEAWLRIDIHTLALDEMNRKADDATDAVIELQTCDLDRGDRPPYALMMARFPRVELLPEADILKAADHM